jgi:hypothetical protein
METRDDEHAVSITSAGPRTPRKYDSRPAAKLAALPKDAYASTCWGCIVAARVKE